MPGSHSRQSSPTSFASRLQRAAIRHGAAILLAVAGPAAIPADHVDSPSVIADPAADIADIFAWTTADTRSINLVMTIPAAAFSDAVQYAFRIESSEAYGVAGVATDVICTFDASQDIQCWVGDDDYVGGDASVESGLVSDTSRLRVYAGARNDPFFFNNSGFNAAVAAVKAAAPSLAFDGAGCPLLDTATSDALIAQLATGGDGFALGTIQAIVLQIDRSLLTAGGDIVAVWGSTHRT
ncbi:MAG TPA: hypothetical protein VLA56_02130 [Pseudomonadales bacterium]|nr:hypothetical protein [Pseudomonadales bacterium]